MSAANGVPRKVCGECEILGWLRNDQRVLIHTSSPEAVAVLELDTGKRLPTISASARTLLAPDEKWVAFTNGAQGSFVAPFRPGAPPGGT
jgi:hypothetical protein